MQATSLATTPPATSPSSRRPGGDEHPPPRPSVRGRRDRWWLALLPTLGFMGVFLYYPLADVLTQSLTSFTAPQTGGLDNYVWFFQTGANVRVLTRTLLTSGAVTVAALLIAYPYAYCLTVVGPVLRRLLVAAVLVPFWTSLMVRNFAWVVLLQPHGPINSVLGWVGVGPVELLGTTAGVTMGEIQILLPFVVLPLYAQLRTIDRRLVDAAVSLGAAPWRAFARIYAPLSLPGVLSGGLLAFVLSLGFYITPALLGSSQQQLLSPLIVSQVSQTLALGRAGAMAAVLLAVTLTLVAIASLASRRLLNGTAGIAVEPSEATRRVRRPVLSVVVGATALVLTLPSLIVVPMSFTDRKTFSFPPTGWSTRWWRALLDDRAWTGALGNSLAIAAIVTVVATTLGTAAALGLVRSKLRAKGVLAAFVLSPVVVPLVVIAIGVYGVYLRWHLTGGVAGFVVAHVCLAVPYVVIPVTAALRALDQRVEDAAASCGARPWTTFWTVTLPLVRPAVLSGALFAFVTSLDETVVSIFLSSPSFRTLPVTIFGRLTRDIDPTVAAASTVMFGLTSLLVMVMVLEAYRRERLIRKERSS